MSLSDLFHSRGSAPVCVSPEVDSEKYQHWMIQSRSLVCCDIGNVQHKIPYHAYCSLFTMYCLCEPYPKAYHSILICVQYFGMDFSQFIYKDFFTFKI